MGPGQSMPLRLQSTVVFSAQEGFKKITLCHFASQCVHGLQQPPRGSSWRQDGLTCGNAAMSPQASDAASC